MECESRRMIASAAPWRCCIAGLAGLLLIGDGVNAADTAALLSDDRHVGLTGESGKNSEIRTVRFSIRGEPAPVLSLAPTDLSLTLPDRKGVRRIDGGQVSILPVAALRAIPGFASYEISVTSLPDYAGTYSGTIQVRAGAAEVAGIDLALTVVPARTLLLEPEPKTVSLALINGSIFPGSQFLAELPTRSVRRIRVPALPEGAVIASVRATPLAPLQGGPEVGGDAFGIAKDSTPGASNDVLLTVDAQGVAPGKYAAVGQFLIAGTDRWISLPIEVFVRTNPWHVLFIVLLGVGLGRIAKYMTDRGNLAIDTQRRYDALLGRMIALEEQDRATFEPVVSGLQESLGRRDYAALAAELIVAETRMRLFERAIRLRAWGTARRRDAEAQLLLKLLGDIVQKESPDSLSATLDTVEARILTNGAAVQADAGADAECNVELEAQRRAAMAARSRFFVTLLTWTRRALAFFGVVLLVFVGFEALYVKGPATFGANPLTDYLSALIWGLTADVAVRTISTLGRSAPK